MMVRQNSMFSDIPKATGEHLTLNCLLCYSDCNWRSLRSFLFLPIYNHETTPILQKPEGFFYYLNRVFKLMVEVDHIDQVGCIVGKGDRNLLHFQGNYRAS